jgi:hypothetical protein
MNNSLLHTLIIEAGQTEKNYWKDLWSYRELFYFIVWYDKRKTGGKEILRQNGAADTLHSNHTARLLRGNIIHEERKIYGKLASLIAKNKAIKVFLALSGDQPGSIPRQ